MRYTTQQIARAFARVDLGMKPKDAAKAEGISLNTFHVYSSTKRPKMKKDIDTALAALKAAGAEKKANGTAKETARPPKETVIPPGDLEGLRAEIERLKTENATLKRMLAEYWAKEES